MSWWGSQCCSHIPFTQNPDPAATWILCQRVEGTPGKGTALVTEGCGRSRGISLAQDKGLLCAPSHS